MTSNEKSRQSFADMRQAETDCQKRIKLPNGTLITREDIIEGLRDTLAAASRAEKEKDPTFVRWPDMESLIEHIEECGVPPKGMDYGHVSQSTEVKTP